MRPATATGDDQPFPGIGVFQRTFSVGDQCVGKLTAVECP
jgi:hypothetical protein